MCYSYGARKYEPGSKGCERSRFDGTDITEKSPPVASFPNSYLPACIGLASLQIAYYAPGREMVWAKFSCLGRSLIWCNPSKSVNPILSNFAPSNPIVLQMIPKCSTCLLSSFHTSALKIVRGKIARTLVLVNLHSWVQP